MVLDAITVAVSLATVFVTTFTKGAFGGGFAILGIPLLALVMDPISAGALLAPMFCLSDLFAFRYWKATSWSKPDLMLLIPAQVAGMGLGFFVMRYADRSLAAIAIAVITLAFAGLWFAGGGKVVQRPRSTVKGAVAGVASGISSMIAHAGGPPVAMYLLPLGLPKALYAGTTFMYFMVANFLKVIPWLILAEPSRDLWWLMAMCVPIIPLGVWSGWHLHNRVDQKMLYRLCYGLLVLVAFKLLWDGVSGYISSSG